MAANELHEQWREAYFSQNGQGAARWKPMKEESVKWAQQNGVPGEALRQGEKGHEINIAALKNSQLPPQFSGENTASATSAITALRASKGADIEMAASIVHEQWLERNGSWAAPELKVPYDELQDAEKEKDRVVVRVAQKAIDSTSRQRVADEPSPVVPAVTPSVAQGPNSTARERG